MEKTKIDCPVVDLNAGTDRPVRIVPVKHETKYGRLFPAGSRIRK